MDYNYESEFEYPYATTTTTTTTANNSPLFLLLPRQLSSNETTTTTHDENDFFTSATDNDHPSSSSAAAHDLHPEVVVLAPFVLLAVGTLLRHTTRSLPLPYTMQLLILGSVLGAMLRSGLEWDDALQRSVEGLGNMDPHLMLHIFLPPLIFESAASLEWHLFDKAKWYIFALAGPGLLLASGLTGIVLNVIMAKANVAEWSAQAGLMLGVIMSATDPVAVVALLKELGCNASLSTSIEGESLLNDGTALVMFTILVKIVEGDNSDGWDDYIWTFVKMSFGGAGFGILFAFVVVKWLGIIFNDALAEITITVSGAYLCFFVAEYFFHVSGVIAVVCLGLYFGRVGKTSVSPEVFHFLEEFWELLAYFGNTLIFVIAGTVIGYKLPSMPASSFGCIALMYVACTIIRSFVVGIIYLVFNFNGAKLNRNDQIIAVWGGLRGAVGLSLAMMVFSNGKISPPVRDQVMFHTAGIVVLTVIVNSSTMPKVVSLVGLDKVGPSKQRIYDQAVANILRAGKKQELNLRADRVFNSTVWDEARKYFYFVPNANVQVAKRSESILEFTYDTKEARRRALMIAKQSYWRQFNDGLLSNASVQYLMHHTDLAIDNNCTLNEWETFSKLIEVNSTKNKMINKHAHKDALNKTRRQKILKVLDSVPVISAILVLAIASTILSFTVDIESERYFVFDMTITTVFFVELCIRLFCIEDWHEYAVDPYMITDTIVVLLDIVLLGAGDILGKLSGSLRILRTFRFIRLVRLLRVARLAKKIRHSQIVTVSDPSMLWDGNENGKNLCGKVHNITEGYKRRILFSSLKHGYEVATGFKVAREEILVALKDLLEGANNEALASIRKGIAKDLKRVQTVLLDMQRLYSEIAASITTAVAARTVLNQQRLTIKSLYNEGFLEKNEFSTMTGLVEFHMKRLVNHPPIIVMPQKKELLHQIPWLEFLGSDELSAIAEAFEDATFQRGEILLAQNDSSDSVHVLARGTVVVSVESSEDSSSSSDGDNTRRRVVEIDELGMGSVFGEIGWALGIKRGASIVATSPGLLFTISGPKLRDIAASNRELNARLWDTCGRRLSENMLVRHLLNTKGLSRRQVREMVHEMELYDVDRDDKLVYCFNTLGNVVLLRGTAITSNSVTQVPILSNAPHVIESNETNGVYEVEFSPDAKFMCDPCTMVSQTKKNHRPNGRDRKKKPTLVLLEYEGLATDRKGSMVNFDLLKIRSSESLNDSADMDDMRGEGLKESADMDCARNEGLDNSDIV